MILASIQKLIILMQEGSENQSIMQGMSNALHYGRFWRGTFLRRRVQEDLLATMPILPLLVPEDRKAALLRSDSLAFVQRLTQSSRRDLGVLVVREDVAPGSTTHRGGCLRELATSLYVLRLRS